MALQGGRDTRLGSHCHVVFCARNSYDTLALFLNSTQVSILSECNTLGWNVKITFSEYRGTEMNAVGILPPRTPDLLGRKLHKPTVAEECTAAAGRHRGRGHRLQSDRLSNPFHHSAHRESQSWQVLFSPENWKSEAKPSNFTFDSLSLVIVINILYIMQLIN